jgi:hypothetical protein
MNFTANQQIRILKSPKKYLIVTDQNKLIFTNDPSIHLRWDFIHDFKLYILKDLKKNMIDFDKYDKQLEDLQNKLKALQNPVNNSDWQNAKFNLSDPTE